MKIGLIVPINREIQLIFSFLDVIHSKSIQFVIKIVKKRKDTSLKNSRVKFTLNIINFFLNNKKEKIEKIVVDTTFK